MKYLRSIFFSIATAFIYLGLPLLGWGLDDLRGFFSLPPRTGYALTAGFFAVLVGVQALSGTEGIRGGKGEESKLNRRESVVRVVLVILLYLALALIPFADRQGIVGVEEYPALRWIGVVSSALGYILVFWSGLALGRQYSAEVTIQKDHRLITSGPYRWIRHPRYLGVLLLAAGISLAFRSWIGLAALAPLLAVLLLRIHDEEALLGREFGGEWQAYQKTSWLLIPGVF
jgi:protein-S-isoprenylcysteine O-methyltransferase Ste14